VSLPQKTYVVGRLASGEALVVAARRLRELGYEVDSHSPRPVHGLSEALGLKKSLVAPICFVAGFGGAATGYLIQWLCNAVDFPLNDGGRPPHSLPAFIPITFETGVLAAACCSFLGVLFLMRLPRLYHPVFDADGFRGVSADEFWISVATEAPMRDVPAIERRLESFGAEKVQACADREQP